MRSSSGSDSASRGVAKCSATPSASTLFRKGASAKSQERTNAKTATKAAAANTGRSDAANALTYAE
jgi:hypothetical protein